MPTGLLGAADLAAAIDTTVYTVPAATVGTVNLSLCNRTTAPITVRVAIAAAGTPANSEFIEFDAIVPANTAVERTGIVMDATRRLVVRASAIGLSAVAWGFEEAA